MSSSDRPIAAAPGTIPPLDDVRSIADAVPALISFFDAGHVCRFANAHHVDWYGRLPEDLVGLHMREFLGDEEYATRLLHLERVARGEKVSFEARVPYRDGSWRDAALRYVPRFRDGGFEGFYILVFDVATQQHRFHSVFDGTTTGFLIVDLAGMNELFATIPPDELPQRLEDMNLVRMGIDAIRVLDANAKACEMLGVDELEILASPLGRWYPDAELPTVAQNMRDTMAGVTSFQAQARLARADGRPIDVLLSTTFANNAPDDTTIAIAMTDMTDEVRRERELADMQARLTHAARIATLGELTSSIAHEVNQPLAAISGEAAAALRWLDREVPDLAEAMAAIGRIGSEASRASRVIGRIRAMAVREERRRTVIDVGDLIRSTLAMVRRQVAALGAEVRAGGAPVDVLVCGDEVQLQQVLMNLVVNAAQAMADVATVDRVVLVSPSRSGGGVTIRVSDTGPGIEEARTGTIFEAFQTSKPYGMGLGLSISRSIAVDHGGGLSFEPGASVGSVFVLELPEYRPGAASSPS